MAINDTTANRGYEKPNAANLLIDDVSRLRTALDQIDTDMVTKADLASPAFTGAPTAPSPPSGENSSRLATTAWVKLLGFISAGQEAVTSVAGKVGNVLLAVGDVSGAAPIASPAFTGTPTAPTPSSSDNSTKLATTAYVKAQVSGAVGSSGNNFTFSAIAPASPLPGDEWFDSGTGIRYTYVDDGNSAAWVETSAPGVGIQGPAGTVSVGAVTTGAAGSSASVTNTGTASIAVLNFTIPRGDAGAAGPMGPKSVSIANPTATEKVALFFATSALTVSQIRSTVFGSSTPGATFSVRYGSDLSAAGTEVVTGGIAVTNTTTGLSTTTFNSASIPANSWVWLTTSATSGTVTALNVSVNF